MVSAANKRKERDLMKLMMSNYEVTMADERNSFEFYVNFKGPKESAYEEGTWKIHVILPDQYPYKSPSIGFSNKVFHPNVDEASGTVCLDVINQTWSPMYDLINIFEVFLPQLLLYPNPTDPLNGEAAALLLKNPDKYKDRVKEYVKKYATIESVKKSVDKHGTEGSDDKKDDKPSECSELSNASNVDVDDDDI